MSSKKQGGKYPKAKKGRGKANVKRQMMTAPVYVGTKNYVDPETGEILPAQIQFYDKKDVNFHKVWLRSMALAIDGITNRKIDVFLFVLDNLNSDNKLLMTQREISELTGASLSTVSETFRDLMHPKNDSVVPILVKERGGNYMINPNILYKGRAGKRMGLVAEFVDAHEIELQRKINREKREALEQEAEAGDSEAVEQQSKKEAYIPTINPEETSQVIPHSRALKETQAADDPMPNQSTIEDFMPTAKRAD